MRVWLLHSALLLTACIVGAGIGHAQDKLPDNIHVMTAEQSDMVISAPQLGGLPAKYWRIELPDGFLSDLTIIADRQTYFMIEYQSADPRGRR